MSKYESHEVNGRIFCYQQSNVGELIVVEEYKDKTEQFTQEENSTKQLAQPFIIKVNAEDMLEIKIKNKTNAPIFISIQDKEE